MKTHEKVIEALKDGQQTKEEISVNALLPASQVSSAVQVLQNRGVVGYLMYQGRKFYYLTGKT